MQISLFLDRFHAQLDARARLDPLEDLGSWVEATHAAALFAAGAIDALAARCGTASAVPGGHPAAALEALQACVRGDQPTEAVVAGCETAFAQLCSMLRCSCDFAVL